MGSTVGRRVAAAWSSRRLRRSTRARKFTWNTDGTPDFGTPARLGTTLTAPSGEPTS